MGKASSMADTLPPESMSARRSQYTTTYKDADGRTVHAATHLACNGLGCAECNGWGFTKTFGK